MKYILLFLLAMLAGAGANAQAQAGKQAPAWEKIAPLPGYSVVATAATANGDVYLVGALFREHDPESYVASNAFVAKWSAATHKLAWLVPMGHYYEDYAAALAVKGNTVYVAGSFLKQTEGFGHPLKAIGNRDVFVTRLLDHGTRATVSWTQQLGTPNAYTEVNFLALDGPALYLAGTSQTHNDSLSTRTGKMVSHGYTFVAKVAADEATGAIGWRRTWPTAIHYHALVGLAARRGKVYLATNTWHETPPRTEPVGTRQLGALPHNADYRLHLTQFSDQGPTWHLDWTRTEAGAVTALAVAGPALYLLGREDADRAFEAPHRPAAAPAAPGDMFIAKLALASPTAPPLWVQRLPGTGYDASNVLRAVAVRGQQVYVAGTFGSAQLALGSLLLTNAKSNSSGPRNLFVAQLTDAGATARFDWAQRQGNEYDADLRTFALVGARLFMAGQYQGLHGEPVLLGKQKFVLTNDRGVLLQSWLPVGK